MRFEPEGATFFYVAEPQSIFGALRPLIKRFAAVSSTADFTDIRIQKIPGAGMDFHVCLRP